MRILSARVFDAMQAPFRAALDRQSREARAEAEKRSALAESAARRDVHEATIDAEASVRARQAEVALREEEARSREAQRRIELGFETERARVDDARARQALLASEAESAIEAHETLVRARELEVARARIAWLAEDERRRASAQLDLEVGRAEAEVARARAQADAESAAARARLTVAHKLPELAAAVGARFGEIKITQIGAGDSPFGSIAQAVASLLTLARDA